MPFFLAKADNAGARIAASEVQVSPGPTRVEYPTEPLGSIVDTADGNVVKQQPVKDPRRRAWVWLGYPGWFTNYQTLWTLLEGHLSKFRKAEGALTPYIYIKDTETKLLRRRVTDPGTATAGAASTITDTGKAWTVNAYTGYVVELIQGTGAGQVRTIQSNTATALTVSPNWSVNPTAGTKYAVRGFVDDWFRARVLEVSQKLRDDGGLVRYDETKLVFVIDDATWNALG